MKPPRRASGPELMDRPDVAAGDLAQGLADLRRVNRWFGGRRAALRPLMPLVRQVASPEVRVLDVATGSGDLPVALARRARAEGVRLRVLATDLHSGTVEEARANVPAGSGVDVAQANALSLPFGPGEFHIAMCHTALHHFGEPDARRVLCELGRVATHAVVVTDLARSRRGVACISLMSYTLWRTHSVTRHDSLVSIRGAYTAAEAAQLARSAGLTRLEVRHHAFFRFSLVARLEGMSE